LKQTTAHGVSDHQRGLDGRIQFAGAQAGADPSVAPPITSSRMQVSLASSNAAG
jgi:hypothetical protein